MRQEIRTGFGIARTWAKWTAAVLEAEIKGRRTERQLNKVRKKAKQAGFCVTEAQRGFILDTDPDCIALRKGALQNLEKIREAEPFEASSFQSIPVGLVRSELALSQAIEGRIVLRKKRVELSRITKDYLKAVLLREY